MTTRGTGGLPPEAVLPGWSPVPGSAPGLGAWLAPGPPAGSAPLARPCRVAPGDAFPCTRPTSGVAEVPYWTPEPEPAPGLAAEQLATAQAGPTPLKTRCVWVVP